MEPWQHYPILGRAAFRPSERERSSFSRLACRLAAPACPVAIAPRLTRGLHRRCCQLAHIALLPHFLPHRNPACKVQQGPAGNS